jgi:hypothetical protein
MLSASVSVASEGGRVVGWGRPTSQASLGGAGVVTPSVHQSSDTRVEDGSAAATGPGRWAGSGRGTTADPGRASAAGRVQAAGVTGDGAGSGVPCPEGARSGAPGSGVFPVTARGADAGSGVHGPVGVRGAGAGSGVPCPVDARGTGAGSGVPRPEGARGGAEGSGVPCPIGARGAGPGTGVPRPEGACGGAAGNGVLRKDGAVGRGVLGGDGLLGSCAWRLCAPASGEAIERGMKGSVGASGTSTTDSGKSLGRGTAKRLVLELGTCCSSSGSASTAVGLVPSSSRARSQPESRRSACSKSLRAPSRSPLIRNQRPASTSWMARALLTSLAPPAVRGRPRRGCGSSPAAQSSQRAR